MEINSDQISPLFSIVIPTYNREEMLLLAIASIQKQTCESWECIVVDDGSTDNTSVSVLKLSQADNRIKYFYQENKERSAARNLGIAESTGKYICFLDSDDQYNSIFLSEFEKLANMAEFDIGIASQNVISGEKSSLIEASKCAFDINYFFATTVVPGRVCIRKEFLGSTRFQEDISISEDTFFLCELAAKNPIVEIAPSAVLSYSVHDGNSVNFIKNNAYLDRYHTLYRIAKSSFSKALKRKIVKTTINDCYFGIFKYYYFNNKTIQARYSMFKAIIQFPSYRFKEKVYLLLFAHKKNLFEL